MKMILINQDSMESMNIINKLKVDKMFVVLEEYKGFSTIAQYSKKYNNFHVVSVKTENLDRKMELTSSDKENF